MPEPTFLHHFSAFPEPRVPRIKRPDLPAILVITLCAIICGVEIRPRQSRLTSTGCFQAQVPSS